MRGPRFPEDFLPLMLSFCALVVTTWGAVEACTPAERRAATALEPHLAGAVCRLAAQQPKEPEWETLTCNVLDPQGLDSSERFEMTLPKTEGEKMREPPTPEVPAHAP